MSIPDILLSEFGPNSLQSDIQCDSETNEIESIRDSATDVIYNIDGAPVFSETVTMNGYRFVECKNGGFDDPFFWRQNRNIWIRK